MFAEERHQEIIKLLSHEGAVKVNQLSKTFKVTEETIRRDLEKLELENKLRRTHGGAISSSSMSDDDDIPFKDRKVSMVKEKKSIAKEAVKLVEEHDILFIDAGSTALYFAKALPNIPLKVLTNSLLVAYEVNKKKNIQLILTGGNLTQHSLSLVGPATIRSVQNYHVNKMFFSCKGFEKERGISDSNEQQAAIKRAVMEIADTVILLVDHSKFNKGSFVYIDSLSSLDYIVVNNQVEKSYLLEDELNEIQVLYGK